MTAQPVAVVYDRASTLSQRDNYSRADAARLVELAGSMGYSTELRCEIKSGEDLVNRPVMRQLLQDVADSTIAAIVVQHLDRLSRDQDQIDGRVIRQICREAGCIVITPDKTYDFSEDVDDDLADVQFLMAKFQKRSLVRQTVTGMKEAARQGRRLPSFVPIGYDAVYSPSGRPDRKPMRDFAVNAEEAALVRRIFDLVERHSQGKVARLLNDDGLRWPVKNPGLRAKYGGRTSRPFTGAAIHDVIHNEMYAGFVTWGKVRRSRHLRDFETARVFRPDLQVVTLEQWNRVQRLCEERKRVPPRSVSSPYLFSGLIKCSHCSGAMSGIRKRGKASPQYWCNLRSGGGASACTGQSVSESVAKDATARFLRDLFAERLSLERYVEGAAQQFGRSRDSVLEEARARLQTTVQRKRNLIDAVADGVLSSGDIKQKLREIDEQRALLERQIAAESGRNELREEIAMAIRTLRAEGLASRIEGLCDPSFQRLCRLVFTRLTFGGSGRGHNRIGSVDAYTFTPEFAHLFGQLHDGASDFAAPMSLRRLGLGFPAS